MLNENIENIFNKAALPRLLLLLPFVAYLVLKSLKKGLFVTIIGIYDVSLLTEYIF